MVQGFVLAVLLASTEEKQTPDNREPALYYLRSAGLLGAHHKCILHLWRVFGIQF